MHGAGAIGTNGAQWQSWNAERTAYLGLVLQKMLRGYTEAAVSITSSLVTVVSRFALQVSQNWLPFSSCSCPIESTFHTHCQLLGACWCQQDVQSEPRRCMCEIGISNLGVYRMRSDALHAATQVGVSLVLSFMVVWDLEAITAGVSSLRSSRLAPFYNEVAPSLAVFGMLFGKALQAQVGTACLPAHTCFY